MLPSDPDLTHELSLVLKCKSSNGMNSHAAVLSNAHCHAQMPLNTRPGRCNQCEKQACQYSYVLRVIGRLSYRLASTASCLLQYQTLRHLFMIPQDKWLIIHDACVQGEQWHEQSMACYSEISSQANLMHIALSLLKILLNTRYKWREAAALHVCIKVAISATELRSSENMRQCRWAMLMCNLGCNIHCRTS